MKDFYTILGVETFANEKDIKKAYRDLAKKYHPDRNQGDEDAAERFKEVSEAYSVLSDPQKRQEHDFAISNNHQSFNSFEDLFKDFGFNPFDPLFRVNHQMNQKDQPSKKINLDLTIDELFSGGKTTSVKVRITKTCSACNGKGGDISHSCKDCFGTGYINRLEKQGPTMVKTSTPCSLCYGRGKILSGICFPCEGQGKIKSIEEYDVNIITTKR